MKTKYFSKQSGNELAKSIESFLKKKNSIEIIKFSFSTYCMGVMYPVHYEAILIYK